MDTELIVFIGGMAAVVGLVAGLVFGILWWVAARRRRLAARMQPTQGTLSEFRIQRVQSGDINERSSPSWMLIARYEYAVGGKSYKGKRATLGFNAYGSEAAAQVVLPEARPGGPVTVWYDPARPQNATLDHTAPPNSGFFKRATIIAGAVGVAGAVATMAALPGT